MESTIPATDEVEAIAREKFDFDPVREWYNAIASRPFDVSKDCGCVEWDYFVDVVLCYIVEHGGCNRGCISDKFIKTLKIVLLNLCSAHESSSVLPVRYNRATRKAERPRRDFVHIIDCLACSGLLMKKHGFYDASRGHSESSKMIADYRLIEMMRRCGARVGNVYAKRDGCCVLLRDYYDYIDKTGRVVKRYKSKNFNEYSGRVRKMVSELDLINRIICKADVRLDLSCADGLPRTYRNGVIDTTYKQLRRIFSRTFSQGGRFYGHWAQRIKSEYRSHLLVDGEATVEIDYSGLHINMLRAGKGLSPVEDAYFIPEFSEKNDRQLVKIAAQVILNCTNDSKVLSAFHRGVRSEGRKCAPEKAREIISAISKMHGCLSEYFGTGVGLKLQRTDSDICARILLALAHKSIPCVPVHDSFIVARRHAGTLAKIMRDKYVDAIGQEPVLKHK